MGPQRSSCHFFRAVLGLLALALCIGFADVAWAQNVFGVATERATEIFNAGFIILDGIGVLGVLGVSAMAMTGRMPWGWAFAILGALMLLKMAALVDDWVIEMATSNNSSNSASDIALKVKNASKMGLYADAQTILYVFSGIAVMALAILSMFGRFQWKWLSALIVGLIILGSSANLVSEFAGTGSIERAAIGDAIVDTETLADRTTRQGQYILYGIGGLASIGLAALAMMGRFSWGWFFAVTGGLILVASINIGLEYITGENNLLGQQMSKSPPPR